MIFEQTLEGGNGAKYADKKVSGKVNKKHEEPWGLCTAGMSEEQQEAVARPYKDFKFYSERWGSLWFWAKE